MAAYGGAKLRCKSRQPVVALKQCVNSAACGGAEAMCKLSSL
jgi:hypothetical protein